MIYGERQEYGTGIVVYREIVKYGENSVKKVLKKKTFSKLSFEKQRG